MLCVNRSVVSRILNCFSNLRSIVSSAHVMEATLNKSQEEQLNKLYPDPKAIKLKVDLHFPNCTLHLLRIPKSIDPELLLDKKIKLQKSECKVKIEGEKYVVGKTTKNPDPVLVLGKTAKVLTLQSNFIMKKFIKPNPEPELEASEKASVAVHDNLKTRHPLFGSAFTDKVIIEEEIQAKLDNAISKLQKSKQKTPTKKSSKHKKEQQQQEVIFSLLADKSQSKADVSDDSAFSSCGSLSKVDKRRKKDTNDFLQNMVRNVKQEVLTAYETEGEVEKSVREKKKKKRKSADHVMGRTSDTTDNVMANHKHKSRYTEPLTQQVMTTHYTEIEDQMDIRNANSDDYSINPKKEVLTSYETEGESELSAKKKKKKKRTSQTREDREHESEVLFNITKSLKQEMMSTYESGTEGEPNTKQRRKKHSSGAKKQEVLTSHETEGEMDTSPKKKKKRNSSAVKSEVLTSYETDGADEGISKKKKKPRSSQQHEAANLSLVKDEMDDEASTATLSFDMFDVEPFSTLGSEFASPKKKRKSEVY